MKAMILAAGRGQRLSPLTDTTPKPLIKVGGKELIVWHIEKLKNAGIKDIVVNSAYLHEKIVNFLKDGKELGVNITHSVEGENGLETAGGIINALDYLSDSFLVINSDVFIDTNYNNFIIPTDAKALLYMVKNPQHNLKGDFAIDQNGYLSTGHDYTFSGIGIYKKEFFNGYPNTRLALKTIFDEKIAQKIIKAKLLEYKWFDVGTKERLDAVNEYLK